MSNNIYVNPEAVAGRLATAIEKSNAAQEAQGRGDSLPGGDKIHKHTADIVVNINQKGNSVLGYIKAVRWKYGNISADYMVGASTGVLFLSIKFHLLRPRYIRRRLAEIVGKYSLPVLLTIVDEPSPADTIQALTSLCIANHVTMLLCWSNQEAARYLETFKSYENKKATTIREQVSESYSSQLADFLTTIRSINRRDSLTLISKFGNLRNLMAASLEELSECPGLGDKKISDLYEAFHGPLTFVLPSGKSSTAVGDDKGDDEELEISGVGEGNMTTYQEKGE